MSKRSDWEGEWPYVGQLALWMVGFAVLALLGLIVNAIGGLY